MKWQSIYHYLFGCRLKRITQVFAAKKSFASSADNAVRSARMKSVFTVHIPSSKPKERRSVSTADSVQTSVLPQALPRSTNTRT